MNNDVKITRVNLDGLHSLDIAINEKAKTVVAELIVGEEMSHVYPLYPMVPEAKEAFNRIAEILLD